MRWSALGVGILGFVFLSGVAQVRAEDRWTEPYAGVRHLHRMHGSVDAHVVLVDLAVHQLSVIATRPEDRGLTVRDFARRYDADIAINANYFHWDSRSCGLAAGDGSVWEDSYLSGCGMSFGFGPDNEALAFESADYVRGPLPAPWMQHVITGKPWLIRHGVMLHESWQKPRHMPVTHPRTAVGLSADQETLILVVADGRRAGIPGLTGYQLTLLLQEFGAYDAINLDGGGSSELFIQSEGGVQNQPSDGRARPVSNHLGIRIRRANDAPQSWHATREVARPVQHE